MVSGGAGLEEAVDLVEEEDGSLVAGGGEGGGNVFLRFADVAPEEIGSHAGDDRTAEDAAEILDEFRLAGAGGAGEEDVQAGDVGAMFAGEEATGGGHEVLGGDGALDVEAFEGVVGGGGGRGGTGDAQKAAMGFEEADDEVVDLRGGGGDFRDVAEGEIDAAGADEIGAGEFHELGIGEEIDKAMDADGGAPDAETGLEVERREADGEIETAAAGGIEIAGGGVGDPDGGDRGGVQNGIEEPLVAGIATREGSQHAVGFVDDEEGLGGVDLTGGDLEGAETEGTVAGGAGIAAIGLAFAALGDEIAGAAQAGGEGAGEGGLAGAGGAVEEDVRRGPGPDHTFDEGAVADGEAAEGVPGERGGGITAVVTGRKRIGVEARDESTEILVEIEIGIETVIAAQAALAGEGGLDGGEGQVEGHGEVADATRGGTLIGRRRVGKLMITKAKREEDDITVEIGKGQDLLKFGEAAGDDGRGRDMGSPAAKRGGETREHANDVGTGLGIRPGGQKQI